MQVLRNVVEGGPAAEYHAPMEIRFFIQMCLMLLISRQEPVAADRVQSDAQVITAVLTQTVRREVDKLLARPDGWRGSPLVVLLDRTIPMCPDKTGPWEECVDSAGLSVVSGGGPGMSSAFTTRNARSAIAPAVRVTNVISAKYETTEGRRPHELYPKAAGWVSVSLPAYAASGEALVYVHFACGALCCHGWFILLEPTSNGWRVAREVGTLIC
jgi:hypothetical protein